MSPTAVAVPKRYQDSGRQKVFEACIQLAGDLSSELYRPDGSPRTGANVRCAFWSGAKGENRKHQIPAGTPLEAAYMAGKYCAQKGLVSQFALTGKVELPTGTGVPEPAAAGGWREGAGAKPMHGQAMQRKQIHLDDASIQVAESLGKGNLSAGIREALRRCAAVSTAQYS